ncbi:hypothetical protein GGI42DRAFT_206890 [Trichoderma sp. SZMC 28013]
MLWKLSTRPVIFAAITAVDMHHSYSHNTRFTDKASIMFIKTTFVSIFPFHRISISSRYLNSSYLIQCSPRCSRVFPQTQCKKIAAKCAFGCRQPL